MESMNFGELLAREILPPKPDPRLDAYPLMSSWTPTALISLAYVVGVYWWRYLLSKQVTKTPKSSKSLSESWSLVKILMVLYNLIMVFYSGYMVVECIRGIFELQYGLGCEEIPDPNDRLTDKFVFVGYLFYFSKFVEMLDTVFFLWRGKVDQVTFLHVFHHASMPPSIWWGLKYAPGGMVYMFPLANSFIHVIMYTYYGLAAAGAYRFLWWKSYLTVAQMIQFVILILHQGQIFVRSTPCNYPKIFPAAIVFYASVFLILFGNFYIQAYWRRQRLAKFNRNGVQRRKSHKSENEASQPVANGHTVNNGGRLANGVVGGVKHRQAVANGYLKTDGRDGSRQKSSA